MNIVCNDEQRMLSESLARYLKEQYSHSHRMQSAQSEKGYSDTSYSELCSLGIAAALLPETCGGYGGSGTDIAVVFEKLGRALVVEPFLSSAVLCGNLLNDIAHTTHGDLIKQIIEGQVTLSLAHYEPGSRYALDQVMCTAVSDQSNWLINGHKNQIFNAATADHYIVLARTQNNSQKDTGLSLFLVNRSTPGLTINSHTTIDGYQTGNIILDNVTVPHSALLGKPGHSFEALEKAIARAVLALCAEAVGVMSVCVELTIEYLQTRKQFGVELGKFQVLQHRMVDVLIELEQAKSAVQNAAVHLHKDRQNRELHISAAKNLTGRTAKLVAEESIQMHGGIAMTWEYSLSHYAKRLIMIDHLLGDTDHHLQRFIELSNYSRDTTTTT